MTTRFLRLFVKIPNTDNHHIIIGGDFNLVQDVILDRSSPIQTTLSKSANVVTNYASQLGILDPWWFKTPHGRTFSFFSHVHHALSWIYYFLLDNNLLDCVNACDYHPITTSDHAPTSVDITFPHGTITPALWRFSLHLLLDSKFKNFVMTRIHSYIDFNDTPDVSSGTLWEALKATVWGQVISYISQLRRAQRVRLMEIADELLKLNGIYSTSPSSTLYKKWLLLHSEHDLLMTRMVERHLQQLKQCFFWTGRQGGDTPGTAGPRS